jgi:hypothetical protein
MSWMKPTEFFSRHFSSPLSFHEEPRYIPFDTGTPRQRIVYALESVLITRKDSGGFTLYKSSLLGKVASSAISTAYDYSPQRHQRLRDTFTRASINLGTEAAINLFKEFWPDISRKIKLNVWLRNFIRGSIREAVRVD